MLARGFPGQVRGDLRTRTSWIGDHPGADDMVEFDKPAACGAPAATVIPRPSPRYLVRFGKDLDIGERDRVRHQQAERGREQRGNSVLVRFG
jgi:hypothetical protein